MAAATEAIAATSSVVKRHVDTIPVTFTCSLSALGSLDQRASPVVRVALCTTRLLQDVWISVAIDI